MDYNLQDDDGRREQRRGNIKDFFKGFFITLAVFLPIIAVLGYFHTQRFLQNQEPEVVDEAAMPQQNLPVSKANSMNVLLVTSDEATGKLLATTLLRFDTAQYVIYITVLPTSTIVLDTRAPMPLYDVFDQRGAGGVSGAIQETLSVPVDRYFAVDSRALTQMIDRLGDFDFVLDKELQVLGDNHLVVFSKQAGESSFSGNDTVNLLRFGNYLGEEQTLLYERLWRAALMEFADEDFSSDLSDIYSSLVNTADTDIGKIEITLLTRAIDSVCPEDGAQIEIVHLPGNYVNLRFDLAEGSDKMLWNYFTKIKDAV